MSFNLMFSQVSTFKIKSFVTDEAHIFSVEEHASLEKRLLNFEIETTNQIVVVTIDDLKGAVLEQFANELFEANGIGQHKEDNGVLLLIFKNDRELRIEVGQGLEYTLTDARCSRIIRNILVPKFKTENYYEGVDTAINQIESYLESSIDDDSLMNTKKKSNKALGISKTTSVVISLFFAIFFLAFFTVPVIFMFLPAYKNLINLHRGLLVGKVGVLYYFALLFLGGIALLLAYTFMLLIFGGGASICLVILGSNMSFIEDVMHGDYATTYNFIL